MSQNFIVNSFRLVENTFNLIKILKKSLNEDSTKGFFLEIDPQYPEKVHEPHNDLLFLPERRKLRKSKKFNGTFTIKSNTHTHKKITAISKLRISIEKSEQSH